MINYILYRATKSFCFIKNVGYYHIKNSLSITNNLFQHTILRIEFSFIVIKLLFDFSKNTKKEKDMSLHFLTIVDKLLNIPYKLSTINKKFTFYLKIINAFLNCKFISNENKRIFVDYKNLINKNKNKN